MGSVIVRILTAKVPAENIGLFNDLLRAQLKELQEQPGLVYAKLARRLNENQSEEVVLVEEWRTPSDLFEWTRGRLTKPRLLPGTEDLIANLSSPTTRRSTSRPRTWPCACSARTRACGPPAVQTPKRGAPSRSISTAIPRPGPAGTGPTPPRDRGW